MSDRASSAATTGVRAADRPILWVTSLASASAPPPAVLLPDRTGAAFYRQVGEHTKTLAEFMAALKPPKASATVLDFTVLPRTLTVAIHRQGYHPADRLERIQVIVKAVNFRFADPQANTTVFDVADLGHLTQETDASGSVSISSSPSSSVGATLSRSQSYDRDLRQRFQDVDVTVGPRTLRVYREGAPGRDLTGALPLRLSVAPVGPDRVASRPVITGVRTTGKDAGIDVTPLSYIGGADADPAPLYACAQLRYIERRVVAGQKYLDEGRQRVEVAVGATPWAAYEIVPVEEVRPVLWRVLAGLAVVRVGEDPDAASDFLEADDARALSRWLARPGASKLGAATVTAGGRDLSAEQRNQLQVVRVQDGVFRRLEIDPALVEPYRAPAVPGKLQ